MSAAWPWAHALAVAVGSAAGGLLRWRVGAWLNAGIGGFPLGTLVVNCLGGLMVGAALAWFEQWPNEALRLLLVTGFLGGLTTFSALRASRCCCCSAVPGFWQPAMRWLTCWARWGVPRPAIAWWFTR